MKAQTIERLREAVKWTGILVVVIIGLSTLARCQEPIQLDTSQTVVRDVALIADAALAMDSLEARETAIAATKVVPFRAEIMQVSKESGLPAALIAALVQVESAFDQYATRVEPHYKTKAVVKRNSRTWSQKYGVPTYSTEVDDRSRSYGLVQIMGQVAREEGFKERFLAALYEPYNNLTAGAKHFRKHLARYKNDTLSAISAYNQGNNRRQNGTFVNGRYVYYFCVAWESYKSHFPTLNDETNAIEPDTSAHATRDSQLRRRNVVRERTHVAKARGSDTDTLSKRAALGASLVRHDDSSSRGRPSGHNSWLSSEQPVRGAASFFSDSFGSGFRSFFIYFVRGTLVACLLVFGYVLVTERHERTRKGSTESVLLSENRQL